MVKIKYIPFSTLQLKSLLCKRLSRCLCLKPPPQPTVEAPVDCEEEKRLEADNENEMKNDWLLAAAVVDRICGIIMSTVFIGGTVIVFILFVTHR